MIIEEGKRYVLRNGSITGPLSPFGRVFSGRDCSSESAVRTWDNCGRWDYLTSGIPESQYDIVSEYALGHEDAKNTGDSAEQPAVRQFATGATRNLDNNKLDYEGFNCPMAQRAFAAYMHSHRKQADGTIRDSANWQAGIPLDVYAKSLIRHVHDFHCLHRGWEISRPEDGKPMPPDDEHKLELLCAIWFNVQGYIHEILKAQKKCDTSSAG